MGEEGISFLEDSQNEGEVILDSKGLDKDLEEVNFQEKNYFIIQGKICYGRRNKRYGLLIAIISEAEGDFLKLDIGLSNKDEVVYIEPDNKSFVRILSEISNKGKLEGRELETYLLNDLTDYELFLVIDLLKDNRLSEVEDIFKEKLEDFIKEAIEVEFYTELKASAEIQNLYPNLIINEAGVENNNESKEDDIIGVECLPVIDPINGTKISELKRDDNLLVQVEAKSYNTYQSQLTNLITSPNDKLVGTIEEIDFNKEIKSYEIFIKFNNKTYGKLTIEAESQLKLAVPQFEEKLREKMKAEIEAEIRGKIEQEIREEIKSEMRESIKQDIREEIEEEIRKQIAKASENNQSKVKSIKADKLIVYGFLAITLVIGVATIIFTVYLSR